MKIFLINGGKKFGSSQGRLNDSLQEFAAATLGNLGHEIMETKIDSGYEPSAEVEKMLQTDAIILQIPGWWMGEPWIVKKWLDEVGMAGAGKLLQSDGRHASDPSRNYGKGGLMQGRKIAISSTWNAPIEAFTRKDDFFEGVGVDGVFLHLYKAFEFMGYEKMSGFSCHDVVKNPKFNQYLSEYEVYLKKNFG